MIEIFLCRDDVHERLNDLLEERLSAPFEILKTENGKPYIGGNPLYFSLSHSGTRGIIAISDKPIGVDLEVYSESMRLSVFERFSECEQAEIADGRDFLKHWTAREAYVKTYGLTIAETWKRIEFLDGKLYFDGIRQNVIIRTYDFGFGVGAVCFEDKI